MASIEKRGDKWLARYRDDAGRQRGRRFDRKSDAQRFLVEVSAAMVTGQYVDPHAGLVTFSAFYDTWAVRQIWAPGTVLAMDLAVRSASFGDVPLARLRRSHIESWIKTMDAAGLAPGTIKTRTNNVRAVLRAAVRDRIIASNPADDIVLPRGRRRSAAMVLPTVEDVGALLRAEESFAAFIALAAFAGLRLGEAAAVQVGDIDFLRRQLTVARQVQRAGKGRVELRPPKYGSERVVYLPGELVALLARHVERHVPGDDPSRWLFLGQNGNPPHQNTVGYWWRKACKIAGVAGVTLHDLRHFYASGLIAAGCDVVTVQRALGHATATTTLNTYAHLWPTAEDRTRAAASDLMKVALSPVSCTTRVRADGAQA